MNRVPLTVRGAGLLRSELKRLKSRDRPQVVTAIAEARAHGDLKENAEYHAAKEQQGFIEARIRDIEGKLSQAEIIDVTRLNRTGRVVFGVTVVVADVESGEEHTYQIVGEDEANIKEGRISVSSPLARALIAHGEGDEVHLATPGGERDVEIVAVRYE
ncbi:MAG: transcription elongation factor GreA [Gammaproteobacteria bacterium]